MISDFSSLIELFAAIYLTISLDDLLLRRFWTPDYEKTVNAEFAKIKMPVMAKRPIIQNTGVYSSYEEKRSRKRGGLMFGITVTLLVMIGFNEYLTPLGQFGKSVILITFLSMELIIYIFDRFFLTSWWSVLWSFVFVPLILGIAAISFPESDGYKDLSEKSFEGLVLIAKIFMVIMLILPVIWQLIRNWLYSRYYLNYIVEQTRVKAKQYDVALRCDPKKGNKIANVALPYHDAVLQAVAAGDGDRVITPFLIVLESELKSIEFVPTLWPLIKHSYRYNKKYNPSNHKLKSLYKQYKGCLPMPKMDKFCEENGIDINVFRSYYQKQMGQK